MRQFRIPAKHFVASTIAVFLFMGGGGYAIPSSFEDTYIASKVEDVNTCITWGTDSEPDTSKLTGMLKIPGGVFKPGSINGYPEEKPNGSVDVAPFWMDRTEVTNAQFGKFVRASSYITEAESMGSSAVFKLPASPNEIKRDGDWWHYIKGADWQHPEGPKSSLKGREHEPVVHVTLKDALAYARWLGHDLPTESEWEFAARAKGNGEKLERHPINGKGKPMANYWQGLFPEQNTRADGYAGRSPVGCYPANGFGLHDMIGNVWEWTRDIYTGEHQSHGTGDPTGTLVGTSSNFNSEDGELMVIKGGSFLCAPGYCARYRASARHPQESNLAVAHVGFRTVYRMP